MRVSKQERCSQSGPPASHLVRWPVPVIMIVSVYTRMIGSVPEKTYQEPTTDPQINLKPSVASSPVTSQPPKVWGEALRDHRLVWRPIAFEMGIRCGHNNVHPPFEHKDIQQLRRLFCIWTIMSRRNKPARIPSALAHAREKHSRRIPLHQSWHGFRSSSAPHI